MSGWGVRPFRETETMHWILLFLFGHMQSIMGGPQVCYIGMQLLKQLK